MEQRLRALVTGGGGYVGGRLCTALVKKGYAVTAVDVHFQDEGEQDGIHKVKVGEVRASFHPDLLFPSLSGGHKRSEQHDLSLGAVRC